MTGEMRHFPVCALQAQDEHIVDYQARVLQFILVENLTAVLTDEQLSAADAAAQRAVAFLPTELSESDALFNRRLNEVRTRIQGTQRFRATTKIVAAAPPPEVVPQAPTPDADEMTREQVIAKALTDLITMVSPGSRGDDIIGGFKSRLIPPKPTLPPGGQALPRPIAQTAPPTRRM